MKPRVQAFRPGGVEAKRLSQMQVAIQIGDTVLVHGGLRKRHINYGVQRMNNEMYAWLRALPSFKGQEKPEIVDDSDSPIWARLYSVPTPKLSAEKELEDVLKTLNARRMVVGHTPQLRGLASRSRALVPCRARAPLLSCPLPLVVYGQGRRVGMRVSARGGILRNVRGGVRGRS